VERLHGRQGCALLDAAQLFIDTASLLGLHRKGLFLICFPILKCDMWDLWSADADTLEQRQD
jgi:hypothetical protein